MVHLASLGVWVQRELQVFEAAASWHRGWSASGDERHGLTRGPKRLPPPAGPTKDSDSRRKCPSDIFRRKKQPKWVVFMISLSLSRRTSHPTHPCTSFRHGATCLSRVLGRRGEIFGARAAPVPGGARGRRRDLLGVRRKNWSRGVRWRCGRWIL